MRDPSRDELRNRHFLPEQAWQVTPEAPPVGACSTAEELYDLSVRVDSLLEANDSVSLARLAHDLIAYGLDSLDEQEAAT